MEMILENLPMALCVLLGMGLILVEVFLPGFGLPGISGIALVGVGTIMAAMHFGTLTAVALLLVIIAVLAVLVSWLLRSAAKGDVAKSKLFLHQKEELREQQDMQVLVGHEGRTLSVLRPSGIGDFDGVRLNVVTEGEFIEKTGGKEYGCGERCFDCGHHFGGASFPAVYSAESVDLRAGFRRTRFDFHADGHADSPRSPGKDRRAAD